VRRLGIMIAGFVLALGLMFGLGHAVQALRAGEEPVVCPDVPLAERLRGHITGLAHVHMERLGGSLSGALPELPEGVPDPPPERLTVVQRDRLYRTRRFDYAPRSHIGAGRTGYTLTVPASSLELTTPVMFVTSACIPDHPVHLRVWDGKSNLPESEPEEQRLRAYLREVLPGDRHPEIDRARPRLVAVFTATLPGCERPAVLGDADVVNPHAFAGVVCLDSADAIVRTLITPRSGGPAVREVAVLDIDGDGRDELIVAHSEAVVVGTYPVDASRTVLLTHQPGDEDITVIDLGNDMP
jgi:hypothetical protein